MNKDKGYTLLELASAIELFVEIIAILLGVAYFVVHFTKTW